MKWWNRIGEAKQQAEKIVAEANAEWTRITNQAATESQVLRELCKEFCDGERKQVNAEFDTAHNLRRQADAELQSAKLYPLTAQEYLNGLAVDADQLTFRACMTTVRALRERSIIPPMGATTTVLHEHAGAINALNTALNYMESERKAAMKKVNDKANNTASIKT